jgi:dipeptidyl aminopeptidase/acylaminoacyl peptidase
VILCSCWRPSANLAYVSTVRRKNIDDDGSHPVRLPIPETDQISDWSSDGRWLVGVSPIPGKEHEHGFENAIMHPDATVRRRLPGPGVGWQARFSPDGKRIAYITRSKDAWSMKGKSIWVVDRDGSECSRAIVQCRTKFVTSTTG